LQPVVFQALRNLLGLKGIGKLKLHRLKTCLGCRFDPVEKSMLGEEHAEVGGEAGHDPT
jgi:hypothetical protein